MYNLIFLNEPNSMSELFERQCDMILSVEALTIFIEIPSIADVGDEHNIPLPPSLPE